MHVCTGTNKDKVSLGKNTTPPPSSWTAHVEKQRKDISKHKENDVKNSVKSKSKVKIALTD